MKALALCRIGAVIFATVLAGRTLAFGQEQRGSIEGTVMDVSGGVLVGAVVEARSPALVGTASVTTDAQGRYRFPALPPGRYAISGVLQGFATASAAITLELGQVLRVDVALPVAGVRQDVEVTSDGPLLDVKQNAAGGIIPREIIDRIPKGRDYTDVVTSLPGVDFEQRNRGIQIDGGSGADNRYFVDGNDRTNLYSGASFLVTNGSFKAVAVDFVEQVQVKQSGYAPEYRSSLGGIVSVITKSGSNVWHGSIGGYYTSDALQGAVRPTLQLKPTNQKEAEYVAAPVDDFKDADWVFELGGPIVRDRLWLYGNYNLQRASTRRTVTFRSNGQQASFDTSPTDRVGSYNLTARLTNQLRGRFAASHDRASLSAPLPNIQSDGTSTSNPDLFPWATHNDAFEDSYSAAFDWVPSPRTYVSISAGHLKYGRHEVGTFSDRLSHGFAGSNFQFSDLSPDLQQVNGFVDAPFSSRLVRDDFSRSHLNADVTRYATWHGGHTLKAGLQFERMTNDVLQGAQKPAVVLFWDASYFATDGRTMRGKYGHYLVTRPYTEGDVRASNTGLFIQDAWTVTPRLTLNLGVRAENEHVPSYRPENPGIHFGFGDKIAPRVGFAFDVRGDSRWKLYGSWGIFHDLMKLAVGRVMFGADHGVEYYYTLDTGNWPSITCSHPPVSGPDCPGTFIESIDRRNVANDASHNLVDPNLQPSRSQEFTFGLDHELTRTTSVGVRYVHKWVDRAVEAVCDPSYTCGVNNPGYGTAEYPFGAAFPRQPVAKRLYDSLEVRVRKRLASRWSMDTSYLWSRLWGNWSGIASSDEAVNCLQPNSCTAFDLLYYSYDVAGDPTYGLLGTDRPHRFKAQATYDVSWGTQLGVNYLVQSGVPFSTIMTMPGPANFFAYGRGDLGRTPSLSQTDLLVQHQIKVPARQAQLSVGLNIRNLFDQETARNFHNQPYRDALSLTAEQFFVGFDPVAVAAANSRIRPDPRFRLATGYQPARAITLQTKLTF